MMSSDRSWLSARTHHSNPSEPQARSVVQPRVCPNSRVGDVVYGLIDFGRDGAAASLVVALENELCNVPPPPRPMPNLWFWHEMLATIPPADLTAWQALFEHGELQEPELELQRPFIRDTNEFPSEKEHSVVKVLTTGAAGAVGFLAVELAAAACSRSQDVHITAVCSSRNTYYMRTLGADVIASQDLGTKNIEDEVQRLAPFDLFLDLTGPPLLPAILSMHNHYSKGNESMHVDFGRPNGHCPALVKANGKIISTVTTWTEEVEGAVKANRTGKRQGLAKAPLDVLFCQAKCQAVAEDLETTDSRLINGHVGAAFPLEQWKEAMKVCEEEGSESAKVIIRVGQEGAS